jgi:hypothetical protein
MSHSASLDSRNGSSRLIGAANTDDKFYNKPKKNVNFAESPMAMTNEVSYQRI